MQTLFAYQQAKISNFNIALEKIGEIFGSKLNTVENQEDYYEGIGDTFQCFF